MTSVKLNILIVGAGPAGSLSAIQLAKQGHQITIIDKNLTTKRKVCGEYLCPQGVELLRKLELLAPLKEQFKSLHGMKIISPNQTELLSFFPRFQNLSNKAFGLSVNRKKFDEALQNKLQDFSNVNFIKGHSLKELIRRGGVFHTSINDELKMFDLVIAADGLHTQVGKIFHHTQEKKGNRIALHCFLPLKGLTHYSRVGQMHIFKDGSYCGLDPIHEKETNFSIVCDKELLKNKRPFQIINHYIEHSKHLSAMFKKIEPSQEIHCAYPISQKNHFIAGDGIAYVGDSAGFIDPLTGEGIFNALFSSYLLCEQIKRYPLYAALKNYKKMKKRHFRQKNILNHVFQMIIRSPRLSNSIARYLKRNQMKADTFIGIIGNIYSPFQGIKKILLP